MINESKLAIKLYTQVSNCANLCTETPYSLPLNLIKSLCNSVTYKSQMIALILKNHQLAMTQILNCIQVYLKKHDTQIRSNFPYISSNNSQIKSICSAF